MKYCIEKDSGLFTVKNNETKDEIARFYVTEYFEETQQKAENLCGELNRLSLIESDNKWYDISQEVNLKGGDCCLLRDSSFNLYKGILVFEEMEGDHLQNSFKDITMELEDYIELGNNKLFEVGELLKTKQYTQYRKL